MVLGDLIMIKSTLPKRGVDDWGDGEFQASRGGLKKHKGIDYACYPGTAIQSPVNGLVTKLGYPYADDLSYRYVQIKTEDEKKHRFFYVEPSVKVGDYVHFGDCIGEAQDIAGRYSTPNKVMKNHIHYEILVNGKPINPEAI